MPDGLTYRIAVQADCEIVTGLGLLLWPEHTRDELYAEFSAILSDPNAIVLLCTDGERAAGFAHCQLRFDYVEGTSSSPVGYLEGIYVDSAYRKRGIARAMLAACEEWAQGKGCMEFGSDCEIGNDASLRFHLQMGFQEANRIISFCKRL